MYGPERLNMGKIASLGPLGLRGVRPEGQVRPKGQRAEKTFRGSSTAAAETSGNAEAIEETGEEAEWTVTCTESPESRLPYLGSRLLNMVRRGFYQTTSITLMYKPMLVFWLHAHK